MIERAVELAAVDRALRSARAGAGATLLLEGPAGIGKTALLAAAASRARDDGMRVLTARGDELERSFPYTVVRQLFEPAVAEAGDALLSGAAAHAAAVVDPRSEPASEPPDPSAVLHGLYWLTANLAADRPVVLVADDLHWSDHASLSAIAYVARRLEGLGVALLLGTRPGEPGAEDELLARLRATRGLQRVSPGPLSYEGVDGLARLALGERVEPAFSAVCHEATQGNPFYVAELLRALRESRVTPTADNAATVAGLTPRAVVAATLARLGSMPARTRAVAEAAALLEPHADLRWVGELTGLEVEEVADAADALLEAGMLRSVAPCRFEHPILRSAVESEVTPARRGLLHLRAARTMSAAGLAVESVAAHLLQTAPSGEPWVLTALEQAATQASARGAPEGAVAFLDRALAERPAPQRRRELLLALGRAEGYLHGPAAAGHLREALALATAPDDAAPIAIALAHALFSAGEFDEAFDITRAVVERHDDHDSQRMLELQSYLLTMAGPAGRMAETAARAATIEARTPAGSPATGAVQACLALRDLVAGEPRDRVRDRAERADAARGSSSGAILGREAPGMAFLWIDDLDRAAQLFDAGVVSASERGRLESFENFSALRGYTAWRRGSLADAAADIEPVLASAAERGKPGIATLLALVAQVLLLIEGGDPASAEALAGFVKIPAALERIPIVAMLRHAQAAAQLATHKNGKAVELLTRVGEVCDANAIRCPTMVPWRSQLGRALAGGDRHDEAREELALAERCDVERARGRAMRALGAIEGGEEGVRLLEDAAVLYERSPARLEHGWACHELGAALRRAGRRRDARAPLDRALDLALACGAARLAERTREELEALGARPRSVMRTGAEALTPSERRVCRLAADGLKNGEIAQALFVSLKTVETHLRSAFRKLDVSSRTQLGRALDAPAG
jgi:DNA-binding CsgD family transcriptional regulator